MNKYFYCFLISILLSSCLDSNIKFTSDNYLTDSMKIEYPMAQFDPVMIRYWLDSASNTESLAFYDQNKQILSLYDIKNMEADKVDTINFRHKLLEVESYKIINFDSILFFLRNTNTIQLHKRDSLIHKWVIDDTISQYGINYGLGTSLQFPLELIKDKILIYIYSNEPLGTEEQMTTYFGQERELQIDIKSGDLKVNGGKFPNNFRGDDYYTYNPWRNLTHNNYTVMYSLSATEEVYVYNLSNNTYITHKISSKYYKTPSKFDKNQAKDYDYITRYRVENCFFDQTLYDKYRNLYYRVCSLPTDYERKDGTVNLFNQKMWSLIIFDENFKVINEVFFPPNIYDFVNLFVGKKGVYVMRHNSSANQKNFKYDIFNFL